MLTQVILPRRASSNWNIYYPLVSAFITAERARPWDEPPASFSVVELGTAFGGNADHLLASLRGAHLALVLSIPCSMYGAILYYRSGVLPVLSHTTKKHIISRGCVVCILLA